MAGRQCRARLERHCLSRRSRRGLLGAHGINPSDRDDRDNRDYCYRFNIHLHTISPKNFCYQSNEFNNLIYWPMRVTPRLEPAQMSPLGAIASA